MSTRDDSKRQRGRPPLADRALMAPITIRFPPDMMGEIEALIASRLDRPEKGAVIRELVAEALAARAGKRRGK